MPTRKLGTRVLLVLACLLPCVLVPAGAPVGTGVYADGTMDDFGLSGLRISPY